MIIGPNGEQQVQVDISVLKEVVDSDLLELVAKSKGHLIGLAFQVQALRILKELVDASRNRVAESEKAMETYTGPIAKASGGGAEGS